MNEPLDINGDPIYTTSFIGLANDPMNGVTKGKVYPIHNLGSANHEYIIMDNGEINPIENGLRWYKWKYGR